jgi:uncharacterized protein YjiS (DUF1127 family)
MLINMTSRLQERSKEMLKFVNDGSLILVTAVKRGTAPLRAAIDRRKERAIFARLLDGGDHLLNDIGLTQSDIEAMLRQDVRGFTPTRWATDPQPAAFTAQ